MITYLLVAPSNIYGLDLGSTGLALKMIIIQFIGVNIQLYFNAKALNLSFFKYLFHQIASVIILLSIAFLVCNLINYLISQMIVSFLVSGIVYSLVVGLMVYLFPMIIGVHREDFVQLITLIKKAQNKVFNLVS
ncbi:MAG: hypothetical protein WC860_10345, partial [Candidatus Margulisiibacteriota bacterium]|jgi:hypothetical protein